MEGTFGKHKNHYNLRSINARTFKTELLWIFFGIHTGNAVEIGKRIKQKYLSFVGIAMPFKHQNVKHALHFDAITENFVAK